MENFFSFCNPQEEYCLHRLDFSRGGKEVLKPNFFFAIKWKEEKQKQASKSIPSIVYYFFVGLKDALHLAATTKLF